MKLTGIHPPVGTVLGPNEFGEYMIVRTEGTDGVTVLPATVPDRQALLQRIVEGVPCGSVTEHHLQRQFWAAHRKLVIERNATDPRWSHR